MGRDPDVQRSSRNSSKRRNSEKAARLGFGDFRFVRFDMARAQKEEFIAQYRSGEFGVDDLEDIIISGYDVKFSSQKDDGSYGVTFTMANPTHDNAGLVLASFAADPITALGVNLFKHRVLADGGQWRTLEIDTADDGLNIG